MKQTVYMIVGCPGAGKTWITNQIKDKFTFLHHDLYIGMAGDTYLRDIYKALETSTKPLLIEAPFSISQYKDPLERNGIKVIPVFIIEEESVLKERYRNREKKEIPKGHITRQQTYAKRCAEWGAFRGTSSEVLEHLKGV